MSHKLIDHSPDLKRLRDEGYEISIKGSHILISNIPYVDNSKKVKFGTLVSVLTISGIKAGRPNNHVAYFQGEQPCNKDGSIISALIHGQNKSVLAKDIEVDRSFSNKPLGGYLDYYQKMTTYINIISGPAISIDNTLTPKTFRLVESGNSNSVFNYPDTNSSRAGISAISSKLEKYKIGIIGVGGTGSYLLDFISKCPVKEIRIFDNDEFQLHNAFRAPGTPEAETLKETPKKVDYWYGIYSRMHSNIIANSKYVIASNLNELDDLDFVFICIDNGESKKIIIEYLSKKEISFIDVGMGIELTENNSLIGIIRVTSSDEGNIDKIISKGRISFADGDENDEYGQNIQIAELNALNASLAVIKWKKMCGFYYDIDKEMHSLYSIDGNSIFNDDYEA
ncbi:ThiF family adenylyltransferase [Muricauda sp. HICW]|uniref:ThiF family adenylyltransferase n=1 Tax=Flagellimonas chongwuensis TaxID=2697365 RepID=A0A850NC06_9FLAO|nr:ThiF family adenylyltransferase [Allomuricauda chongwuensis]NVN18233.1 ThiF family adenylyltransferase [Allomuricauda chongwuensis]